MISYSEAKNAGGKHYFTGAPCVRGHTAPRFVSTRACVECLSAKKAAYRATPGGKAATAAYDAAYRRKHLELLRDKRLAAYSDRREVLVERSRTWKHANRGRVAAYGSAYKKARPAENAARAARYKAAKAQATPPWADYAAIAAVYEEAAFLTDLTGERYEVDHYYPLAGKTCCGLHVHQNLRAIPERDNRRKYNKVPS